VVIGTESERAREVMRRLYRPLYLIEAPNLIEAPIVFTGIETAELTKYAANAFVLPMSAEQRLASLGLTLPPPPTPIGNYVPFHLAGNLLFLSGVGPRQPDGSIITGKLGAELDVARGYAAARMCGLNLLVNIRAAAGSLDRVGTILKVLGMVNAVPSFTDHPQVIDGCTDLFVAVFGEAGRPARSAVGMGSLPRNISVEVEAVVLLQN
jgi:enamine deaminase RidA (YjgF/YER057c/UK114 family)